MLQIEARRAIQDNDLGKIKIKVVCYSWTPSLDPFSRIASDTLLLSLDCL
jgi:D-mannonate dehydratase